MGAVGGAVGGGAVGGGAVAGPVGAYVGGGAVAAPPAGHPGYPGGAPVRSGCSPYHSVLAAAAFANGLTEERALQLFNSYFFARLGYLDRFAPWKDLLLSKAQEIGYDLHKDFQDWLRQGAFMHTWQHPTVRVMASVAVRAIAKANLRQTVDDPHDVPDALAHATALPVFPEIARSAGVAPIAGFRKVAEESFCI